MSELGENWTDSYDGSGAGWSQVAIGSNNNAVWFSAQQPVGEVTVSCKTCGHTVTIREGDEPIPFGDPRLCEHF